MKVKGYKSNGYTVGDYGDYVYLHNGGGHVVTSWYNGHPHYIVL